MRSLACLLALFAIGCTYDFDVFRPQDGREHFETLALGADFACAIRPGGQLACWGGNYSGQLGTDSAQEREPVDVAGATDAVHVAASYRAEPIVGPNDLSGHACIVTASGAARCLGDNRTGQLGLPPDTTRHTSLTDVPGLSSVVSLSAGASHTCAVTRAGDVFCWGDDAHGQLGNGDAGSSHVPARVEVAHRAVKVALGRAFSCSLGADGVVECWGENGSHQLGDGSSDDRGAPVENGVVDAVSIEAGGDHACALIRDGSLECWGVGAYGALGNGGTGEIPTPVVATVFGEGIAVADAGGGHTCVRTLSGRQLCVGGNDTLQIGAGPERVVSPFELAVGAGDRVIGGGWFTCARESGGGISCWGANWGGQLGDGTSGADRAAPAPVHGFP